MAIDSGAHSIEAVASLGRLKDGDDGYVLRELRDVAQEGFGIKGEMDNCEIPESVALIETGVTRFGLDHGAKLIESLP